MQERPSGLEQISAVGKRLCTSVAGQPEAVNHPEPHPGVTPTLNSLIGEANECVAHLDGHPCLALLDTGSQVTSVSHRFYQQHLSNRPLRPVDGLVRVVGAAGQDVPFLGYIELNICLKDAGTNRTFPTLALVVPDNEYNQRVPLILGTNVVKQYIHYPELLKSI